MTVKELKEKLEQFDENMEIMTFRESCMTGEGLLWSFTGLHTAEYYGKEGDEEYDNVLCIDFDY